MQNEALLRFGIFFGLFLVLAALEQFAPRRPQTRVRRWWVNWALIVVDSITLRAMAIFLPLLAVGAALDADARGWGLFNAVTLPFAIELILTILILDFAIWAQHLITHKVPILWRLHQVHHTDDEVDVTTAIRFHPVEIALSMLFKIGLVYLLGPAAIAVLVFEILLNATAMFSHSNLFLPLWLDRILRIFIVTPDMHRVHHSVDRAEHDMNYGFALSLWDRIFGTYLAQPRDGHADTKLGLRWRGEEPRRLNWLLLLPFRNK